MIILQRQKHGFSLIELILVIGIMMVLLSLTLPAVQKARGVARRLSCANNLRQVALAIELHKSAKRHMPSGTRGAGSQQPHSGLFLHITPYLEQQAIYDRSVVEFDRITDPFEHSILRQFIGVYLCPEDGRIQGEVMSIRHNRFVATTSYLGVNGVSSDKRDGVLYVDSKTRDAEISDGLSYTLLLGERPPSRYFDFGWWYAGVGADGNGTLDHTLGTSETRSTPYNVCGEVDGFVPTFDDECSVRVFWSPHEGVTHYAMCDSSIHLLSSSIDRRLMDRLATRANGEVAFLEQ
jgi:type II secretory pathway pseudopilin PulG